MTVETTIGPKTYRVEKLDPFKQFHIVRILSPVVGSFIDPIIKAVGGQKMSSDPGEAGKAILTAMLGSDMGPTVTMFLSSIRDMSEKDSEYIIRTCLSAVSVKEGTSWAKMTTPAGAVLYQDVELPDLLALSWKVITHSLARFFPEPPPT